MRIIRKAFSGRLLFALSVASILSVAISLQGCEDPPNCYYDNLFGCGTFDIPWSSSYYPRAALATKAAATSSYSGVWRLTLEKESSGCTFAPDAVNTRLVISDGRAVTRLIIPGMGSITARKRGQRIPNFSYRRSLSAGCKLELNGSANFKTARSASVNVKGSVSCSRRSSNCSASYSGNATR